MPAQTGSDLWVFGYGSLMWRPDFPYVERVRAMVAGHHRAFCIASTMHRGSQARPGLVLGLDRGRAATGIAYRVAASDAPAVIAYLRERELIYGVYREARLAASLAPGASVPEAHVLAYTVERCHPSYVGRLHPSQQARIIASARGQSGANLDYLINTVQHLQALGIRERALERLMTLAAGHAAAEPGSNMHRWSVAGRWAVLARRLPVDVRVPLGDQRRFGHRLRLTG